MKPGTALLPLALGLACLNIQADGPAIPASVLANSTLSLMSDPPESVPSDPDSFTLTIDQDQGLEFDVGGSDMRKLRLQLEQPVFLNMGSTARIMDNGSNLLGLDATLDMPVSDAFSLNAGVRQNLGEARFQSLGSIQCLNGTLRADSYTASGCRFVNEPLAATEQQRIDLGAEFDLGNAAASISWFTQTSELDQPVTAGLGQVGGRAMLGPNLLSPNLSNPLLAGPGTDPLRYLNSEASGVNLNFKVGYTTNTAGDLKLGLAFSRILDAGYAGIYSSGPEMLTWTLAEPFNSARMDIEWKRGSFSSGVQAYYRDSVNFLNRNNLDSLTTFDVHFTWRTPWNADLSLGASNVLNAGSENAAPTDSQPSDPFESIYGRIPYVRYKQDL